MPQAVGYINIYFSSREPLSGACLLCFGALLSAGTSSSRDLFITTIIIKRDLASPRKRIDLARLRALRIKTIRWTSLGQRSSRMRPISEGFNLTLGTLSFNSGTRSGNGDYRLIWTPRQSPMDATLAAWSTLLDHFGCPRSHQMAPGSIYKYIVLVLCIIFTMRA